MRTLITAIVATICLALLLFALSQDDFQIRIGGAIFLLFAVIYGLWVIPHYQAQHLRLWKADQRFDKENEARKTLAQIIGGTVILAGLWFTSQQLKVSQTTIEIAERGQATTRLTTAVNQLSSNTLGVRLGGIYALERIGNDSEKDHWPVMEILTAYVRQNARTGTAKPLTADMRPPDDIQAIMNVIGRRAVAPSSDTNS